ncbi:hypothetical protein HD554DRAFT_2012102, partial [Boletus coccyginus]
DFFLRLFNSCFLIDFRTKWHDKLRKAYQNDHSVHNYISELIELWNLITSVNVMK